MIAIERDELKHKLDSDQPLVLLEVSSRQEYAQQHLPGAQQLPPDAVREIAPTLIPDRVTEVVVYCSKEDADRSRRAANLLDQMAYANVRHYESGKEDWLEAGLPTEPES